MQLHGKQFIGSKTSAEGGETFRGFDPSAGRDLEPVYHEATDGEVDRAMRLAETAFEGYRRKTPQERARFLVAMGEEIDAIGDALVERAAAETGLPADPRLKGERARTVNQLKMFANLLEEGSWVDARIDRAMPDRKPLPRADIRRMLMPMGPVVAFAASNFPLAISVAGNDTASGLAAGCPVVVKAHPAHPGTSELVAAAIVRAAERTGMPEGVFSLLHGRGHALGLALVRHPATKAVGFTGSLRAGRALHDAGSTRQVPIPVYAEMGSVNPVFVLPGALAERGQKIAEGLKASVTLGVGQFCTCPGLVLGMESEPMRQFADQAASLIGGSPTGTMLYKGLGDAYNQGVERFARVPGVRVAGRSAQPAGGQGVRGPAVVFSTDAETFLKHDNLHEELFGPSTMVVTGRSKEDLLRIARGLEGQLSATIHGTPQDFEQYRDLIEILQEKVGRLVFNGFPTGIEPCQAIHHGGPYPATSDGRTTGIGTAAIERWVRPICYQDSPQFLLPPELQDPNPRNIWRLVDGVRTREPVQPAKAQA
jgi:2,5-dioxopentanoate dehydrogenase